jgi:asparagine synthase (glutamine-hydrolysing)
VVTALCGIVGAYYYGRSAEPVSEALLVRMRETLRHRGPDDAGCWINPGRQVGLAHRRLSIIDLSDNGRQPLADEHGRIRLTFNGEIYNHPELRRELLEHGHRFRSRTDCEVIVHLYEEAGPACLDRLDGMFAFALWDEEKQQLLLARDPLGVKPLYYTCTGGVLLFASEIKALLVHPLVARDVDLESLYHYLTFKTTPAPRTMFAGIRKLPAGHHLTCDRHGDLRVVSYWDPADRLDVDDGPIDLAGAAARVRDLLEQAVAKRAAADVPMGVFLSGGLDSSAILAILARSTSQPIHTFSAAVKDDPDGDELGYARQMAELFGTRHHEVVIGSREVEDYLPRLVETQDEPLADPVCVPLFYLAERARQTGVFVVHVGEGSDEQFLGYDSRVEFLRSYERRWRPLLALPWPLLQTLHAGAALCHAATGWGDRYRRILRQASRRDILFWGSVAFSEEAKRELLNSHGAFDGFRSEDVLRETTQRLGRFADDMATRVSYLDLRLRLAELLLMRLDKVTMSVGVEAREPFLDHRLVEFVLRLPGRLKLAGGEPKAILKEAVKDLVPAEIIRRPKQPFAAPVRAWLRGELGAFARRALLESRLRERAFFRYDVVEKLFDDHLAGRRNAEVQLWTLLNLSAWYDRWIAGSTNHNGSFDTGKRDASVTSGAVIRPRRTPGSDQDADPRPAPSGSAV